MNARSRSTNPFIIDRIFPYADPHTHGLPVAAQLKHFLYNPTRICVTSFNSRELLLMCFASGMLSMSNDDETNAGFVLGRSGTLQGSRVRMSNTAVQSVIGLSQSTQSITKIRRKNHKFLLFQPSTFLYKLSYNVVSCLYSIEQYLSNHNYIDISIYDRPWWWWWFSKFSKKAD